MSSFVADFLAWINVAVAIGIVLKCLSALRYINDRNTKLGIDIVLGVAAGLIALRLLDQSVPLEGDAKTISWRSYLTLMLIAFWPLINALVRRDRHLR